MTISKKKTTKTPKEKVTKTPKEKPIKIPVCSYCHININEEFNLRTYKRMKFHAECLNKYIEEHTKKVDMDIDEKTSLINYICEKHKLYTPTGTILQQIKYYVDQYHYKLKGIEWTLRYYYDILGNPVGDFTDTIGIVPYLYEEARRFYTTKLNAKKYNDKLEDAYVTTKTVKIKLPTTPTFPHLLENANMEDILDSEE